MNDDRRAFLGQVAGVGAALGWSSAASADGTVDRRTLGRTGRAIPILGLGLASFFTDAYSRQRDAAEEALEEAIRLGAAYFDTANAYGASQQIIAPVVRRHRRRIFLVSKSAQRSYDGLQRELERSLNVLGTDRLDLFHLHSLTGRDNLAAIERGALRAARRAKEAGTIGAIGITGHSGARVLIDAVRRFDPDVLMTVLSAERRDGGRYETELLPLARERNLGVLAMKAVAFGWRSGKPVPELIRYALSLPGVHGAVIGLQSVRQLRENAALCTDFQPLRRAAREELHRFVTNALAEETPPWERPGYVDGHSAPPTPPEALG